MLKSGVFFEEINDDGTIEKGLKILEFITEYQFKKHEFRGLCPLRGDDQMKQKQDNFLAEMDKLVIEAKPWDGLREQLQNQKGNKPALGQQHLPVNKPLMQNDKPKQVKVDTNIPQSKKQQNPKSVQKPSINRTGSQVFNKVNPLPLPQSVQKSVPSAEENDHSAIQPQQNKHSQQNEQSSEFDVNKCSSYISTQKREDIPIEEVDEIDEEDNMGSKRMRSKVQKKLFEGQFDKKKSKEIKKEPEIEKVAQKVIKKHSIKEKKKSKVYQNEKKEPTEHKMPTKEDKKDKAIERKQSKIEDLNVSKHENDELLPKQLTSMPISPISPYKSHKASKMVTSQIKNSKYQTPLKKPVIKAQSPNISKSNIPPPPSVQPISKKQIDNQSVKQCQSRQNVNNNLLNIVQLVHNQSHSPSRHQSRMIITDQQNYELLVKLQNLEMREQFLVKKILNRLHIVPKALQQARSLTWEQLEMPKIVIGPRRFQYGMLTE